METSFLERITTAKRADAIRRRFEGALDLAQIAAEAAPSARPFASAFAREGMSLIAEIKRASPSAGDIAPGVDRIDLARAYERGGASAISVLTEPEFFRGSLDDLRAVRDAVAIPVMRKDFLCDALHVWEARAAGADAVLLIVAALPQADLQSLHALATNLGMGVLVEVHDAAEVPRALAAGAQIIGINARNLATLAVDPAIVRAVRPLIPADITVVAESGVSTRADVEAMEAIGCAAVLIGEALMRAPNPATKIAELLGRPAQ